MALLIFRSKLNRRLAHHLNPSVSLLRHYCAAQNALEQNSGMVEKVEYPPIIDKSPNALKDREKMEWHEAVKKCPTIEEKLIKVNMPAYWGLRTTPLENDEYFYNCLPFFQHWTRTQYETGLPTNWFKRTTEEVDCLVNNIREQIIEAVQFQYRGCR